MPSGYGNNGDALLGVILGHAVNLEQNSMVPG